MRAASLLVVLALVACSSAKPLVITGEAIDAAGLTFEATAAGMDSANNQHLLTAAQVEDWNAFLPRFQKSYHLSVSLWRMARATGDSAMEQQATATLAGLMKELGTFTPLLLEAKNGGAP